MTAPLIVPVEVEALVVNDRVRTTVPFQRWTGDFKLLKDNLSPEPAPFSDIQSMNDPSANGVYLHWQLPQALTHGRHDQTAGSTTFPLVPNRWLVVRYAGPGEARAAAAWVVESDFVPDPDAGEVGTSAFLHPYKDKLSGIHIGRKVTAGSWQEGEPRGPLFLTAAGAGLITLTVYQPYNENVFSLHDPLDGVADAETLSYQVIGWYSAPDADPLAGGTDLAELSWVPAASGGDAPTRSLYSGTALGLAWDRTGDVPESDRPSGDLQIDVAVGNSSVDALTALVEARTGDTEAAALLDALQYGLLDTPSAEGSESVDQAVHRAWFGSDHGGYTWEIAETPTAPPATGSTPDWLTTLVDDQAAHDDLVRQLADQRWRLYSLWWISHLDLPDQYDADDFTAQLDPDGDHTLARRIRDLTADLTARRTPGGTHPHGIPWGTTQDELTAAVTAYATAHGLPDGIRLRRVPLPEFHRANDPVVLLNGVKSPTPPDLSAPLPVRRPADLVSGIDLGSGLTPAPGTVPGPAVAAFPEPDAVTGLFHEFWLLDQALLAGTLTAAATDPATKVQGILPARGTDPWRQPWQPLYMVYELCYYPVPYRTGDQQHWDFDGTSYDWNGTGRAADAGYQVFSGRILLTPHAGFNLASRLRQYIDTHPDADTGELTALADAIAGWDLLSQGIDGLNSRIAQRDPSPNVHPSAKDPDQQALAGLVGGRFHQVPMMGPDVTSKHHWPDSTFPQVRAGQFSFMRLSVVDRFGQSVNPVDKDNFTQRELVLPDDLKPKITVEDLQPARFVELPPRLHPATRLRFDYVDAHTDDTAIDLDTDHDPVCAWLLPDHLDGGLACYDPAGRALGEIRMTVDTTGTAQPTWEAAPDSRYPDVDSLRPDFPHLADFLTGLIAAGADALPGTMQAIDETLWTVNPLGDWDDTTMTVLAGRPLALVRARLRLEPDGPPLFDPSWEHWQYELDPKSTEPRPGYLDYPWQVRLGALEELSDGLVGYFHGTDYTTLHTVHLPEGAPPYLTAIGPGFPVSLSGLSGDAYVTMIVDPRAAVHAVSDVLPASVLVLPAKHVDRALRALQVSFRVGPLPAVPTALTGPDGTPVTGLAVPRPATRTGTWELAEPTAGDGWIHTPLGAADPAAGLPRTPPALHTGRMRRTETP
ncbi:hypothetical protein [Streptomyces sp. NPDC015125]|uniref:hypothetical protein n=1 Tax=Streptomyces sp. NPDC015125 TaxID=3364938 RepID=UPI0036FF4B84